MNAIEKHNAIRDAEANFTHAQIVVALIERHNPSAVTLYGGYMVSDVGRVLFSNHYGTRSWDTPHIVKERRNKDGRCTLVIAEYSDGSRIMFTWSANAGPRYKVMT